MPEEKYGDIDVNPIETRIDTKNKPVRNTDQDFAQAIETATVLISEQVESDNDGDLIKTAIINEDILDPVDNGDTGSSAIKELPEVTSPIEDQVAIPAEKSKKHKKKIAPIIAGLSFAAIILGGSAFAFYYNLPEKVATDAITGLIKQSNRQLDTNGSFEISPQTDSELYQYMSNLRIDFKTGTNNFDHSAEFDFGIKLRDDNYLHFKVGAFLAENGTAYLNIDNLADAYQKAVKALDLEQANTEEINLLLGLFQGALKKVEGKWWRIDINETLDSFDKTEFKIEKNEKQDISSACSCIFKEMKQELSQTDRFTKAYLDAPFIKLAPINYSKLPDDSFKSKIKDYGNLYQVSLDADKLLNFVKTHQSMAKKSKVMSCLQGFAKSSNVEEDNSEEFTKADAQKLADHLKNLYLGIDFLTHQLKGVYLQVSESKVDFTGIINFKYQNSASVTAPRDAVPLSQMFTGLFQSQDSSDNNSNTMLEKLIEEMKNSQISPELRDMIKDHDLNEGTSKS